MVIGSREFDVYPAGSANGSASCSCGTRPPFGTGGPPQIDASLTSRATGTPCRGRPSPNSFIGAIAVIRGCTAPKSLDDFRLVFVIALLLDRRFFDDVAFPYLIDDVHTLDDMAEDSVLAVQMGRLVKSDEEL